MSVPKEKLLKYNYLIELCKYHRYLYYQLATNEISDREYDMIERQVKRLEDDYPDDLNRPDSPTRTVGC